MTIDRQRVERLQLQYELAMAIGTSLEMQTMLRRALSTFLRKLNCSAGGVFIRRNGRYSRSPEYAIPRRLQSHETCHQAIESLLLGADDSDGPTLFDQLPIVGGDEASGYHYILALADVGFITLVKQRRRLEPWVTQSLTPLLEKLAGACLACLQNEELAASTRRVEIEHNLLRTVIANTPTIVFAVDRKGRFTLSEGHGLEALGRAPSEIVGQSIFEYYADVPEILDAIRNALDGQPTMRTVEMRGLSFDAYYEPLFGDAGRVEGVVGVAYDITERKDVAETLDAVLNAVGEGIITIDSDGDIVMVNLEASEIFGYASEQLLGANLVMLMPERFREAHKAGIKRYLATGDAHVLGQRIELEGLHSDGHTFPLEIRIQEAILRERHFFTASVRDITRRKEYDRMHDDFVSTVSHELRTPLTAILGWSETLLSGRPGPLTADQERFLKIIENSSRRLQGLIEEILTVSRVQSGTLRLEFEPFLPSSVIASIQDVFASMIAAKSMQLVVEDSWPGIDRVKGDGTRMEQVLTNLIGNAIKFSPEGSVIRLESRAEESAWQVRVHDSGIGIPAAELPHMFERFYRASTAKDAQIQGTGLGLYICKAIIEGHGGSIDVTSEIDVGTTVSFLIPVA